MFIRGGRGNAIDHAVWKEDVTIQPIAEIRISQLREGGEHFFGNLAIALDVVTRH
jgi:hypothetical protein